ncbi:hypothetical protein DERP_010341 [Dermatophagoides pteronyssinus]|nr:hypothetical protein DERP_010341 [Dermatophagoides pteronyssinus]
METFPVLQHRLEKLNRFNQLLIPIGVIAVVVLIDGLDHLIQFIRNELIQANIIEGIHYIDGDNPANDLLEG